jgi:hypothetical protein
VGADHDRNRQLVQLPLHLEGFKRIIANLRLEAYVSVRDLGIYVTMSGTDFVAIPPQGHGDARPLTDRLESPDGGDTGAFPGGDGLEWPHCPSTSTNALGESLLNPNAPGAAPGAA